MMALRTAEQVIDQALAALAPHRGVVIVRDGSDAEVRFANNTVTTNGVRSSRSVTVIAMVTRDGGMATGSATRSGDSDPAALVAAALAEASTAPLAHDAADLVDPVVDANFSDAAVRNDLSILDPVLGGLGDLLERAEGHGVTVAGFAEHSMETTSVGTTTGLRRRFVQPTGSFQLVGRADGGARSSWVGTATADFTDVDLVGIEAEIHRRLDWGKRQVALPAGRYETLLPPSAVADLMAYATWMAGGQDAEDGGTVFSSASGGTRVGDRLSALPFTLASDPFALGLECLPFVVATASGSSQSVFDNGLPLAPTTWIDSGRLSNLHYHRAGAARSGVAATPMIDNVALTCDGGAGSIEDLISSTERALLVTCLWYIRIVDPATLLLTGLTRDGVYLVQDGAVVAQVNNYRFNESPLDVLAKTTEVGASVRTFGREFGEDFNRMAACPLRVADFNMSSVSKAN